MFLNILKILSSNVLKIFLKISASIIDVPIICSFHSRATKQTESLNSDTLLIRLLP